jgi:hypothetical protein
LHTEILIYTVKKAERDAGPQHKGDGKFRHPYTVDREALSLVLTAFSDRSTWMTEFSVTLVFWSCVTLGFFNSGEFPEVQYL